MLHIDRPRHTHRQHDLQELLNYEPVQVELQNKMIQGSKQERDRVLLGYSRYLFKLVQNFPNIEDAFQEAFKGLCRAAQDYNPEINSNFQTYATWWIRDALSTLRLKTPVVRIPPKIAYLLRQYRKAEEFLTQAFGYKPTFDEICDYLEFDEKKIKEIHHALNSIPDNWNGKTMDVKEDTPTPQDIFEKEDDLNKAFKEINTKLSPDEREVFYAKIEGIPRQEIADSLSINLKQLAEIERVIREVLSCK